jgi:hypothetical protein
MYIISAAMTWQRRVNVGLGQGSLLNPFTAEVAIMRLLGSAPKSHLCDHRRRSKVTGLSDLMTLFIDLECLYCKQTQRAFNVFKNTLNWLNIDSVDQKFNRLEYGNFSQDAGTPGTERVIAFSQLAVKWLKSPQNYPDTGHLFFHSRALTSLPVQWRGENFARHFRYDDVSCSVSRVSSGDHQTGQLVIW